MLAIPWSQNKFPSPYGEEVLKVWGIAASAMLLGITQFPSPYGEEVLKVAEALNPQYEYA